MFFIAQQGSSQIPATSWHPCIAQGENVAIEVERRLIVPIPYMHNGTFGKRYAATRDETREACHHHHSSQRRRVAQSHLPFRIRFDN